MKKVLMAAAALTAGLCVADVSSQNTVGYIKPANFREGYTLFGPSFADIGKQTAGSFTLDVQNIIPTGDVVPDGKDTTKTINIQKLAADGGADGQTLYWTNCQRKKQNKPVDCYGWYPASGTTKGSMTLEAGDALWVLYPTDLGISCALQVSGEVPSGEVYKPLREGYTAIGNPTPVTVDIQHVQPFALDPADVPDGKDTTKTINIQKLAADGGADSQTLYWTNCQRKKQNKPVDCFGWYPASGTTQGSMTLGPGEGIWTLCPENTTCFKCSLVFPAPIPAPAAD